MKPARRRAAPLLAAFAMAAGLLAACAEGASPAAEVAPAAAGSFGAGTPLTGATTDYDPLISAVGDTPFVLLGESTHGTSEFYGERARITERLVRERGFLAVAIEGDWPETDRVNRYVRGLGDDRSAAEALSDFKRFPRWMWRNTEFAAFAERLRAYNLTQPPERRVGVYGMDVYNLFEAADAVVAWLSRVDPPAAARARTQYRCFVRYDRDTQKYGQSTVNGRSCQAQAAAVLQDVRNRPRPADLQAAEAQFSALRSAASVVASEEYFRANYAGENSWNLRDRRMAATVSDVAAHVAAASGGPGKVAVWAHNTHVGDARATDMSLRGELNIGQLLRSENGERAFLVGFLTHSGTVMAAPEWDAPGRVYTLRPALPESYAGLFHASGLRRQLLMLRGQTEGPLAGPRLERAVGVIYRPNDERLSHYFQARLSRQFDAAIFIDQTRAVTPLR